MTAAGVFKTSFILSTTLRRPGRVMISLRFQDDFYSTLTRTASLGGALPFIDSPTFRLRRWIVFGANEGYYSSRSRSFLSL